MFTKLINWWKRVTKFTPPKVVKTMTTQECMDEYTKLWDSYAVFELTMKQTELNRLRALGDSIEARGYDIYGSPLGVKFIKRK
jgi:hypothetical protein